MQLTATVDFNDGDTAGAISRRTERWRHSVEPRDDVPVPDVDEHEADDVTVPDVDEHDGPSDDVTVPAKLRMSWKDRAMTSLYLT